MYYVYLIKSLKNPSKTYVGYTTDLQGRLEKHNSGGSVYTADFKPWKLVEYLAFEEESKAIAFDTLRGKIHFILCVIP